MQKVVGLVLFLALAWGCTETAPEGRVDHDGGLDGASDGSADPEVSSPESPTSIPNELAPILADRAAYCAGAGAPIIVSGSGTNATCTGVLAERLFRYAICSCEGVASVTSEFRTSSFDSATGTPADDESGASVGINTVFAHVGALDIGGSLTVAGEDGFEDVATGSRIRGDLSTHGGYRFVGNSTVARNAIVGALSGVGSLTIGGDLRGAEAGPFVTVAGSVDPAPSLVEPPCACGDEDILDIGSVVANAMVNNHNPAVDLQPGQLTEIAGTVNLDLPCGRFYVDEISGVGTLTLVINGRTALFVGGDVEASGGLNVVLGPEGELDLFIAGGLRLVGNASFGSVDRPASTRIYVGGEGEVEIAGSGSFVGNLYAPRAPVRTVGDARVYGSLFSEQFDPVGEVSVVYDRAIQRAGDECIVPPPQVCNQCGDCPGGTACVDGSCGACRTDADCCAPLVCTPSTGRCEPLLI